MTGRSARLLASTPLGLLILALSAALAGCSSDPTRGYSFTSTYSNSVHTVAVPVFDNQTFYTGLEVQLTDAIIKEIQRKTPWVVVSSDANAQTTLSGKITDVTLRQLSISSTTGYVQEVGVELSVDFEWRDGRTGKVLTSRKDFRSMEGFVPAHASGEPIELGESAAVQELARAMVAELRSGW